MKIIDLLNKIANGEEVPEKIKVNNMYVYEYDKDIDYKTKDGTYLFDSYIQIKKEDMNMEVEILEDNEKYIGKYNTGLDNGRWTKESIKDAIESDNMTLEKIVIEIGKEQTLIKEKLFELIDKVNS